MSVIPLTVFLSLGLVLVFVVLFLREQRRRPFASAERDSLLPLAEELPVVQSAASVPNATIAASTESDHEHDHEHHHKGGRCGCLTGERSPCDGGTSRRHGSAAAH